MEYRRNKNTMVPGSKVHTIYAGMENMTSGSAKQGHIPFDSNIIKMQIKDIVSGYRGENAGKENYAEHGKKTLVQAAGSGLE